MNLSQNDLLLLSQSAIHAVFQAAEVINQFRNKNIKVNEKIAGQSLASQVVTEVDYLSQAIILQTIKPSCKQFDLALLTEESPDDYHRLEKDFFWCIDPLDGTLPFIESTSGYSIVISLVSRQGVPYIGVVYDPFKQTLYHAIKGQGVFRNKLPWKAPLISKTNQKILTFITDRSFTEHKHYSKVVTQLKGLGYSTLNIIQHGGAAMNACWVLENPLACYFKFPKPNNGGGSLWDFSATTCIFNEMNAIATDIYGQPLDLNRPDSTFMNHRGVLYATNKVLAKQVSKIYSHLIE